MATNWEKEFVQQVGQRNSRKVQKITNVDKRTLDNSTPIYIYTTYKMNHHVMLGNFGQFYLKGVDTHGSTNGDNWEPYHLATTLKSHLLAYDVDKAGEGNMNYEVYDGWEIAADLLKRLESDKNKNLENWGVFASDANPPSEEEVKAAKRKLETNLNAIVMEGDLLSRGTSNEQKSIGERHRDAANYLKVTRDWAKPIEFLIACPFCGQAVMEDAPICKYCSNIIDKAKYDEVKASIDSKAKKAKNI